MEPVNGPTRGLDAALPASMKRPATVCVLPGLKESDELGPQRCLPMQNYVSKGRIRLDWRLMGHYEDIVSKTDR